MSLVAGARLGPYEILGAIGAGGQGEVYKAKDTRLDRTVAIKVLPEHLAESPERRERFEREAKTISQLNHPHICTIHDVGRHDAIDFIVLEYIEGETLAQRLKKGALTFEKSLEYGTEIANALAAAHHAGIVHRDLKPANVMLTKSGVKVLDFGLAKHTEPGPGSDDSGAPTRQQDLTKERSVVGTLRYMAPEQLVAEPVDSRTDLWALGVVLYEMLSGVRPFEGESQATLVGAILKDEPRPLIPQPAKRAVEKCLRKDRGDRWQTARDLEDELRWIAAGGANVADSSAAPRPWRRIGPLASAAAVGAMAAFAAWSLVRPSTKEAPVVKRFTIELPEGQRLAPYAGIAVSPDGRNVVYLVLEDDGQTRLYLRPIGAFESRALPGTEGAVSPFFSSDGQWVAFGANGKLLKIPVEHGATLSVICDALLIAGASWEADGTIFFSDGASVYRVPASGGVPAPAGLTAAPSTQLYFGDALPGDQALLYVDLKQDVEMSAVSIQSLETSERKVLIEGGISPRYLSTGHILFETRDALMGAPFDSKRLAVTGPAVPMIRDLEFWKFGDSPRFDVSAEGTLVYVPSASSTEGVSLSFVDRAGAVAPVQSGAEGSYLHPRISPDGRRIALSRGITDIWVIDLHRDTMTRLTFGEGLNYHPVWSHDGKRIFFNSNRENGVDQIFWLAEDGSGAGEALSRAGTNTFPTSASSDGTALVFQQSNEKGNSDIGVLPLQSEGDPEILLGTPFNELSGVLSPDDRWLAYVSDESGRSEVYVRPFRGSGDRVLVSTNGAVEPMWSKNGRELFYRSGYKLMAVPVSAEPELSLGKATTLFERPFRMGQPSAQYDVAADGRFVMLGVAASSRLHVVLDWFEELRRLVPEEK